MEFCEKILKKISARFNEEENRILRGLEKSVSELSARLRTVEYVANQNNLILSQIMQNQILLSPRFPRDAAVKLCAEAPLALDSNDTLFPESTLEGVARKPRFTNKIKEIFGESASLLDIGCGGGGVVYDALASGVPPYGVDGSDENKKLQSGYWSVIPGNLLTADATKPFHFEKGGQRIKFKVVSSWECLEHIPEGALAGFLDNVFANLDDGGYFIGSISRMPYEDREKGVVYHVTLKDKEWWKAKFEDSNLEFLEISETPFIVSDFCRGVGLGWQDAHTNYLKNKDDGILFVAKKKQ
ncbi:MAG: class I SAM-dependent methyltransferase [Opitutales bacterium]|nr:class I SAM-dependent methyltransferase [Opitutales bacterium]